MYHHDTHLLPDFSEPAPSAWEGAQPSSLLDSPRQKDTAGTRGTQGLRSRVKGVPALSSRLQVGVVQYGEDAVHEFHLNDYRSVRDVVEAASHIEQRGGTETRTAFGIEFAR